TIEVFQKAADLGLRLGSENGNTLTFQPSGRCPSAFVETLKAHKWHLLALLSMGGWLMAFSKVLGHTVLFAGDKDTRAMLVEAGADPGSVYTRDELRILVGAKRTFNAKLVNSGGTERPRSSSLLFPLIATCPSHLLRAC